MSEKLFRVFVICPPGLESELLQEVRECWPWLLGADARVHSQPEPEWNLEHGGLAFQAPLVLALQLNFFLRTATRILIRVAEFKAKDFDRLSSRLRDIRFQDWWGTNPFTVEVAAAKSRLNNEKRIFEIAKKSWKNADEAKKDSPTGLPLVMIRAYDDQFSISIDTSGRHLHFREALGQPKPLGEAPLRETLAAACLRRLLLGACASEIANVTLWDPMAGSGTFLSEAERLFSFSWSREFAFQKFQNTPKLFRDHSASANYLLAGSTRWKAMCASDIAIDVLQKNAKTHWQVRQADVADPKNLAKDQNTWIVCNPPYQQRLKMDLSFAELAQALSQKGASRISVLIPDWAVSEFEQGFRRGQSGEWKIEKYPMKNGGIEVVQVILNHDSSRVQGRADLAD